MPNIGKLDENFILISVDTVSDKDWKTSVEGKTVKLPKNHDMRTRIGSYKFDYNLGKFEPITVLNKTGENAIEFGNAVADAIILLAEHNNYTLPSNIRRALTRK